MVTPEDITKEIPDPFDAPYAGLLFWRSSYVVVKNDFADQVATLVGIVGPSSGDGAGDGAEGIADLGTKQSHDSDDDESDKRQNDRILDKSLAFFLEGG